MMIVCATSQFCMSEHIYPNSRDSIPLVLESKKVNLVTVNVSLCSETLVDGLGVVGWLSSFTVSYTHMMLPSKRKAEYPGGELRS